jgi:hypothetical protein
MDLIKPRRQHIFWINSKAVIVLTGTFKSIDGSVEGIEYRSGNQFGRTNDKGEFSYEEGKKIKFSIYQLELGTTQGKISSKYYYA